MDMVVMDAVVMAMVTQHHMVMDTTGKQIKQKQTN
jgi:hypothetical protein